MARKPAAPPIASDEQVSTLLARYNCPVPFHEVRTRFLGGIASPTIGVSPIKMVESLWGDKIPEFPNVEAANELMAGLVMGLWNRLTQHQERSAPFRLTRTQPKPKRAELAALALMRCQELDGFLEGLYGNQEAVGLPERARRGLEELGEMRALFMATLGVASDRKTLDAALQVENTLRLMQQITKNAEHEIHAIVIACSRARRNMLSQNSTLKPTLH